MVIWIIGLPGSGKTTLAKALQHELSYTHEVLHIDGDDMREIWGDDIGYSLEDREKNSNRIQKLSKLFEKQGFVVVVSIMSIFEKHRIYNRTFYDEYFEVFLDVDLDTLKNRRAIYQDALDNKISNVVGVDIPYDMPETYDIQFNENLDLQFMLKTIKEKIDFV